MSSIRGQGRRLKQLRRLLGNTNSTGRTIGPTGILFSDTAGNVSSKNDEPRITSHSQGDPDDKGSTSLSDFSLLKGPNRTTTNHSDITAIPSSYPPNTYPDHTNTHTTSRYVDHSFSPSSHPEHTERTYVTNPTDRLDLYASSQLTSWLRDEYLISRDRSQLSTTERKELVALENLMGSKAPISMMINAKRDAWSIIGLLIRTDPTVPQEWRSWFSHLPTNRSAFVNPELVKYAFEVIHRNWLSFWKDVSLQRSDARPETGYSNDVDMAGVMEDGDETRRSSKLDEFWDFREWERTGYAANYVDRWEPHF
ncbi:hypothetical protein M231_06427 [Tremella mesenterica]|uniref:Uncharacterized protein n=1 Tax=Tremella mesenterica TaxID=5217 RepID=A0A4Q1BG90_TREME|nr:hypothetical protein M231_06427 [Tremella mesenterica]